MLAASKLAIGGSLDVVSLLIISKVLSNGGITISGESKYIPFEFEPITIDVFSGISIALTLFIASALVSYSANTQVLKLSVDIEKRLIDRYFLHLSSDSGFFSLLEGNNDLKDLTRIIMGSTRLAGRMLRQIYSLIHPTLKSITLLVALLVLDTNTTILVLGLLLLLAYVQYVINRRAANYSRSFDDAQRNSRMILSGILKRSILSVGRSSNDYQPVDNNHDITKAMMMYRMRIQVTEESKLATSISKSFLIMCVLALTFSFSQEGLSQEDILTSLIFYIPALAFFIISLQSVLAGITNISRFYPQVNNYFQAIRDVDDRITVELSIPTDSDEAISLSEPRTIIIISNEKQAAPTHLKLIQILKKQKYNEKTQDSVNIVSSSVSSADEVYEKAKEKNTVNIIYIPPKAALQVSEFYPTYHFLEDEGLLSQWTPNSTSTFKSEEIIEEDDFDEM